MQMPAIKEPSFAPSSSQQSSFDIPVHTPPYQQSVFFSNAPQAPVYAFNPQTLAAAGMAIPTIVSNSIVAPEDRMFAGSELIPEL